MTAHTRPECKHLPPHIQNKKNGIPACSKRNSERQQKNGNHPQGNSQRDNFPASFSRSENNHKFKDNSPRTAVVRR